MPRPTLYYIWWGEKGNFIVKRNLLCLLALVQGMQVLKEKKSIKDLVVFSSVLPRFISLSPLEGEMFDTVKTWMLAHVRRIIPSYHELAMMSSQLTCTSTIT